MGGDLGFTSVLSNLVQSFCNRAGRFCSTVYYFGVKLMIRALAFRQSRNGKCQLYTNLTGEKHIISTSLSAEVNSPSPRKALRALPPAKEN